MPEQIASQDKAERTAQYSSDGWFAGLICSYYVVREIFRWLGTRRQEARGIMLREQTRVTTEASERIIALASGTQEDGRPVDIKFVDPGLPSVPLPDDPSRHKKLSPFDKFCNAIQGPADTVFGILIDAFKAIVRAPCDVLVGMEGRNSTGNQSEPYGPAVNY